MPEISRFFGIVIRMYFGDHTPPHFHAKYGDDEAVVDIHTLVIIGGHVPPRALGMIVEWGAQHQKELLDLWELAANGQRLHRIAPLE